LRTFATFRRLAKNRSRLGTGTMKPFGVFSVGSFGFGLSGMVPLRGWTMPGSGFPCIYCERPANSEEHILAIWLIADRESFTGRSVLQGHTEYGNDLVIPVSVTHDKHGTRQFNFTSRTICDCCNSGLNRSGFVGGGRY
jgi:hypothetical protein